MRQTFHNWPDYIPRNSLCTVADNSFSSYIVYKLLTRYYRVINYIYYFIKLKVS